MLKNAKIHFFQVTNKHIRQVDCLFSVSHLNSPLDDKEISENRSDQAVFRAAFGSDYGWYQRC